MFTGILALILGAVGIGLARTAGDDTQTKEAAVKETDLRTNQFAALNMRASALSVKKTDLRTNPMYFGDKKAAYDPFYDYTEDKIYNTPYAIQVSADNDISRIKTMRARIISPMFATDINSLDLTIPETFNVKDGDSKMCLKGEHRNVKLMFEFFNPCDVPMNLFAMRINRLFVGSSQYYCAYIPAVTLIPGPIAHNIPDDMSYVTTPEFESNIFNFDHDNGTAFDTIIRFYEEKYKAIYTGSLAQLLPSIMNAMRTAFSGYVQQMLFKSRELNSVNIPAITIPAKSSYLHELRIPHCVGKIEKTNPRKKDWFISNGVTTAWSEGAEWLFSEIKAAPYTGKDVSIDCAFFANKPDYLNKTNSMPISLELLSGNRPASEKLKWSKNYYGEYAEYPKRLGDTLTNQWNGLKNDFKL